MEIQPQLVLLQKTLLNIEGLGRQLYPDLDLWQTAKPFLENWMHEQFGIRRALNRFKQDFPRALDQLPQIPFLLHEYLEKANQGRLEIKYRSAQIDELKTEIKRSRHALIKAVIGSSALVASTILFVASMTQATLSYGAWALGGVGVTLILLATRRT